jgi:putative ABC transport system permease protein
MKLLDLAWRSLWNRRSTALLTLITIAISTTLLLGIQLLKTSARDGFTQTLTGTDLIVGARSGPINLLLYSVFRIGDATNNVSWSAYQTIAKHRDVAWTVPLALGDTHRGYRVLGTTTDYFEHYRFADNQPLQLTSGRVFSAMTDVVLGAEVARDLKYELGDAIVLAHGLGEVSFTTHEHLSFRVSGILKRTGTPVDRTVHIPLEAVTALHEAPVLPTSHAEHSEHSEHETREGRPPDSITAFLVGMRSRVMAFTMERAINQYRAEPLLAIMPGVALSRLWELVGAADMALTVIAAFVVLAGLLGMAATLLTSLNERRREIAILRSVGAQPRHVLALILTEAGLLTLAGVLAGVMLTYVSLIAGRPLLQEYFGVFIPVRPLAGSQLALLGGIVVAGLLVGWLPARRAYRTTLSDGLQIRV